jgi:hypothetical protein
MNGVQAVLRAALGGAVCGSFVGIFTGGLAGALCGGLVGNVSIGLDGALLGGAAGCLGGAAYGAYLAVRESRPETAAVEPPAAGAAGESPHHPRNEHASRGTAVRAGG